MSDAPVVSSQLVYVILGAPGSGRREVIADLITGGVQPEAGERAHLFLPVGEAKQEADARSGAASVAPIAWDAEARALIAAAPPAEATHVFIVLDGTRDPVDQLEALKPWLVSHQLVIARIFSVMHCRLIEQHSAVKIWYDACVHFSDVVLLNRREGVANKWLSDFRATYDDQFMPCLFEFVKAGRVKNPPMLLNPVARRLSQYFDASEWDDIDLDGIEIGESDDEDGENARPLDKTNIDPDNQPPVDPYFERQQSGRRVLELPDIRKYLPPTV